MKNNEHYPQLGLCCLGLYSWNDQVSLVCLQAESFDEIDFINITILRGKFYGLRYFGSGNSI